MTGEILNFKNINNFDQLNQFLSNKDMKMVIGQYGGRRVEIRSNGGETITLNLKELYQKFKTLAKDQPNAPEVKKLAGQIKELNSNKNFDGLLSESQKDRKIALKISTSIRQVFGNLFSNLDKHFPSSHLPEQKMENTHLLEETPEIPSSSTLPEKHNLPKTNNLMEQPISKMPSTDLTPPDIAKKPEVNQPPQEKKIFTFNDEITTPKDRLDFFDKVQEEFELTSSEGKKIPKTAREVAHSLKSAIGDNPEKLGIAIHAISIEIHSNQNWHLFTSEAINENTFLSQETGHQVSATRQRETLDELWGALDTLLGSSADETAVLTQLKKSIDDKKQISNVDATTIAYLYKNRSKLDLQDRESIENKVNSWTSINDWHPDPKVTAILFSGMTSQERNSCIKKLGTEIAYYKQEISTLSKDPSAKYPTGLVRSYNKSLKVKNEIPNLIAIAPAAERNNLTKLAQDYKLLAGEQ